MGTTSNIDAELVPLSFFEEIDNEICDNVLVHLQRYRDEENHHNLIEANNNFDDILVKLFQLLALSKKSEVLKPIKKLENLVDNFIGIINEQKTNLETKINEISINLKEQEGKLNNIGSSLDSKNDEINSLNDKFESLFNEAQGNRREEFESWFESYKEDAKRDIDTIINQNKETTTSQKEYLVSRINDIIEKGKEKHKEILALHEIVAGDSVAAGYLQSAENEKKQANFWRWATIIFISATGLWTAISYFYGIISNENNMIIQSQTNLIADFLKAFSVTGVLLFGAAYSAKQSNIHRQNERKTRWFALEVKAIDPFISSLNEADRTNLKNKLSERLFGQQNTDIQTENNFSLNETTFHTITKGFTDLLKSK